MIEYSVNTNRYRVPKNIELMVDYVVYGENDVKIHCLSHYFYDDDPERIEGSRYIRMHLGIELIVAANPQEVYAIKKGEQVRKTGHSDHDVFADMECRNRIGSIPNNSEIVITGLLKVIPFGIVVGKLATQSIRLFGIFAEDAYVIVNSNQLGGKDCLPLVYASL